MKEKLLHAVYTGKRLHGDKIYQRFELLPDRDAMHFTGISRVYIGGTYEITEDHRMAKKPQRVFDLPTEDNADWDAKDTIATTHAAKKRAEAKYKAESQPALRAAKEALKPLCKGLNFLERDALIRRLVNDSKGK
jgi:hypothetical protein